MTDTTARLLRGATAGLIAGVVASFVMEAAQALATNLSPSDGDDDDAKPATVQAAEAVTGAPITKPDQPLAGEIVHYLFGAGLGVAYGITAEFRPRVTLGYGTGFGLAAAALFDEAAVPAAGLGPTPWETPPATHLYGIASHLVFGLVAEFTRSQVNTSLQPN